MAATSATVRRDERAGRRSLLRSVAINGGGSFLVFHLATPHYPKNSPLPLVWSSVVPAFNLARGIVVKRAIDFVAGLACLDIAGNVAVAFVTGSLTAVFVAHGARHAVIGLAFLISALVDRPLVVPLLRQIVAGDDPAERRAFDERAREPRVRTAYRRVTLVWAVAFFALSAVLVTLALAIHSSRLYVVEAVLTYGTMGALGVWTYVWMHRRVRAARAG